MRCVVSRGSTSLPWLVLFFAALLWRSMIHKYTGRWIWQGSTWVVSRNWEKCSRRYKLVSTLSRLLSSMLSWRVSQAWNPRRIQLSPGTWSFWLSARLLKFPCWCRWCCHNLALSALIPCRRLWKLCRDAQLILPVQLHLLLSHQCDQHIIMCTHVCLRAFVVRAVSLTNVCWNGYLFKREINCVYIDSLNQFLHSFKTTYINRLNHFEWHETCRKYRNVFLWPY